MDSRRRLVWEVLEGGQSLSAACRQAGVTRVTGRKWVERAREEGIEGLSERSRAPHQIPRKTESAVEQRLLELRGAYPEWGARKLVPLLKERYGMTLPTRTAEHILRRHGLTKPHSVSSELQRFEREACGMLLQMDFKGLPSGSPYALLTVLDDHSRFCLAFEPVPDRTAKSVQKVLWDLFEKHGLPERMLMDNGDCWGSTLARLPTRFEAWLMRLGIGVSHGRPHHPQTQGKVERFHRTAKLELGSDLIQPSLSAARQVLRPWVDRYNWVRPHDALGSDVPGAWYRRFPRYRPDFEPQFTRPSGISRKVDADGYFSFKGRLYKAGKGLIGEYISLQETPQGLRLQYAGFDLAYLEELPVWG